MNYDTVTKQKGDIAVIRPAEVGSYDSFLTRFGIEFVEKGLYFQSGKSKLVQGWILHISVILPEVEPMLNVILPLLAEMRLPFKLVKDQDVANSVLNGELGPAQLGKLLSIYPETTEEVIRAVKKLLSLAGEFKGPAILTDFHLGGPVYTRYGSHDAVLIANNLGKIGRFIYTQEGTLMLDASPIPFQFPATVDWPFIDLVGRPTGSKQSRMIHGRYDPLIALKEDVKGNVVKAHYVTKWIFVRSCVIKQGKAYMNYDEYGRDMRDRLAWQDDLHCRLFGALPLPKRLDRFSIEEDDYLVMEYIKGPALFDRVTQLNKKTSNWLDISIQGKKLILNYALQLILIIQRLHDKGIVHRDITPVNFLVDKSDKLWLIDIELAYSLNDGKPGAPFRYGTYGFMSPEQQRMETPTIEQDVYGLGATLIVLMIQIPGAFGYGPILGDQIDFFLKDKRLSNLLASCLSPEPDARPSLTSLEQGIREYLPKVIGVKKERDSLKEKSSAPDPDVVNKVIQGGLRGLVSGPTVMRNGLWYSKTPSQDAIPESIKKDFMKVPGLYEGVSGVLYVIARAKMAGYNIDPCLTSYRMGWEYITGIPFEGDLAPGAGLYWGRAGIALAAIMGMKAGLINPNDLGENYVQRCIENLTGDLNLATGVAGQGTVLLQCVGHLTDIQLTATHNQILEYLESAKPKNASWITIQDARHRLKPMSSFGFGNGGIIWYLLAQGAMYNRDRSISLAKKVLPDMQRQIDEIRKALKTKGWRETLSVLPFSDTYLGACLTLIKAYATIGDKAFRDEAEDLLSLLPTHIIHENLNQDSGLAGLGELYVEAAYTLKNQRWLDRAAWITSLLVNTAREGENGSFYWSINNATHPTADLMIGTSGIIHALMNYVSPIQTSIRILK